MVRGEIQMEQSRFATRRAKRGNRPLVVEALSTMDQLMRHVERSERQRRLTLGVRHRVQQRSVVELQGSA